MSTKKSSDALSRIRRGRRPSSVEPRVDPLSPHAPIQMVPINKITDRSRDTRPINLDHVAQLVESIKVIGLITPLAVDRELTLLAGAHRLEALKRLAKEDVASFERLFPERKVPARVMELSADTDQLLALRVEVEENEKRRDYTSTEVFEVAQTLEAAGFTRTRGRPNVGEKPLIPALEAIFGKSKATIKRYLAQEEKQKTEEQVIVNPQIHMWKMAQEKCETLVAKVQKIEREVQRATEQWEQETEMRSHLSKHQTLLSALEVSSIYLAKARNSLQVDLEDEK
jgi:ParB-like chromosome segregation protein Spo0J